MITGPHEKKWCGKFFWEPFLNKFELLIGGKPGYRVQEIQKKIAPMFITHQVAQISRLIQKSKMAGAKCETLFINLFKSFNNPIWFDYFYIEKKRILFSKERFIINIQYSVFIIQRFTNHTEAWATKIFDKYEFN